jgi:hypothetical protein
MIYVYGALGISLGVVLVSLIYTIVIIIKINKELQKVYELKSKPTGKVYRYNGASKKEVIKHFSKLYGIPKWFIRKYFKIRKVK